MHRSLLLLAALLVALPASAQSRLFAPVDAARTALTTTQATYLGHLEAIPATVETHFVAPDLAVLDQAVVTFNLTERIAPTMRQDRVERSADRVSYFFAGDRDDTHAIFIERQGHITGTVRHEGALYTVRPLGDGLHTVVLLDESKFVDHAPEWDEVEAEAARRHDAQEDIRYHAPGPAPEANTTQRVLVPYTPNAEAQVFDIVALCQLAVDETNQGYINSDVSVRIVAAHIYRTPQNESSSFSTTLNRMQNNNDGYHDEIDGLRTQYGADMVQMVAGQNGSLCGQARTILADDASEAFAIASQTCATGYYTFGHEFGHLQGARHNPEADGSTSPFPYGHGKYYIPGNWRTVMSYSCNGGCTRVLQWSNPDVNYNGTPTGDVSLRDNARVLDFTAKDISAFYPEPSSGTASVSIARTGPATVGSGGGPMTFNVTVSNTSGGAFSGEFWVLATLPNGNPHSRDVVSPTLISLNSGQSQTFSYSRNVPSRAPAGTYTVTAYAGASYPNDFDDQDSFTFSKSAAPRVGAPVASTDGLFSELPADASVVTELPTETALLATYPNPFSASATVQYALAADGDVRLAVYDVLGREVAVLVDGALEAGAHTATLEASDLATGTYVVRLQAGGTTSVERVTLQR